MPSNPAYKKGKPCASCRGTLRYRAGGHCVECNRRRCSEYYSKNEDTLRRQKAKYQLDVIQCVRGVMRGDIGEAGECLVSADLLLRGYRVTKPINRVGKDDLHVKVGKRWYSVQVKVVGVNRNSGTWTNPQKRSSITSDLLAMVDAVNRVVRYRRNVKPVPKELRCDSKCFTRT